MLCCWRCVGWQATTASNRCTQQQWMRQKTAMTRMLPRPHQQSGAIVSALQRQTLDICHLYLYITRKPGNDWNDQVKFVLSLLGLTFLKSSCSVLFKDYYIQTSNCCLGRQEIFVLSSNVPLLISC